MVATTRDNGFDRSQVTRREADWVGATWIRMAGVIAKVHQGVGVGGRLFRSGGFDWSLHSLHKWTGFHMIRSVLPTMKQYLLPMPNLASNESNGSLNF
jgi:hypothetical protein